MARKYRLFVLLLALTAFFVFTAIADMNNLGRISLSISLSVVFAAAINASRDGTSLIFVVLVIGLVAIFFQILRLFLVQPLADVVADMFTMALLVATTWVVLRRILIAKASNFDTLSGAAAVYLLLGLVWAASYDLIERASPGAFEALSQNAITRWNELVYFSMTTLTTLGYGDIKPVNPLVRIWATLEAVTGVLYVAILIARLVSNYSKIDGQDQS